MTTLSGSIAIIALHGGIEGWHAACRARRAATPDYALSRIIGRLLRRHGDDDSEWRLIDHDRQKLTADPELAAYWQSVAAAGKEGWREEKVRIIQVQRQALSASDPDDRLLALDNYAIQALIPTWRAWGQVLWQADSIGTPPTPTTGARPTQHAESGTELSP